MRVIMAALCALTAVSRAILISLIASICPSASLGVDVATPARTARAACSASSASLFPERRRSPLRGGRPTGVPPLDRSGWLRGLGLELTVLVLPLDGWEV